RRWKLCRSSAILSSRKPSKGRSTGKGQVRPTSPAGPRCSVPRVANETRPSPIQFPFPPTTPVAEKQQHSKFTATALRGEEIKSMERSRSFADPKESSRKNAGRVDQGSERVNGTIKIV